MTKKELLSKAGKAIAYAFSIAVVVLVSPVSVRAQNTDSSTRAMQLREININRYRLSKQSLSPTPLQILTESQLKRINSLSVADAIRYFSGVQLKDYGGIGGLKTVNVRSMGSNHTAVFYNGIQLGNAQNGQVDLGKYSLDNLEEISLVSGQNTDLLQPARAFASASAIYLKTKAPDFEEGKSDHLSASLKGGSFGLFNPAFSYQRKLTDNLTASFSSEYVNANGKYKFRYTNGVYDTTATRNNGDVDRLRVEAALYGKMNNNGSWNAQIYSFFSERGLPGAIIANKFDYSQRIWDRSYFVQGGMEQHFNKFTLLLNGKLAYDYTRYLDPEYITLDGFLDNRFQEREAYLSVAGKYQLNKIFSIGAASDFSYQNLDANLYRFAYPSRNTFLNVFNASMQLERLQLQGNVLSTTVSDKVKAYGATGNKHVFSPAFLFSYQPLSSSKFRIRGFYKDIFRLPTFNDLYYTLIGNANLKPEYTKQYDLGFTFANTYQNQRFKLIDLQADVYYNTVKDKIIAQPGANLFRWTMYNLGKVEIKGLEMNAKSAFDISADLSLGLGLSYTYQQAIDVTSRLDDNYRDQIPYTPKHSGSFLSNLDYGNWKLNYSFIYTGARYNQKANIIYNYMEPWYTHDAAIGYQFKTLQGTYFLNFEVNNFLNQYYDVIPNFPLPGRNYRLSLNFKI